MGKVFVKGPVESPDDLLAKQAMAQRLQNFKQGMGPKLGAGFEHARNYAGTRNYGGAFQEGLSSVGRVANNEINDFGQLTQAFFDPFFTLFGRKPQTPEEEERSRQMIKDKIREERQPAMDASKEEADNQALLSRFQNLSQRTGADIIGLDKYKGKQDLSEFQEFANMNYPGMPLNDVANMLGQQFTNVEGRNIRNVLAGKPAIEGYAPEDKANQIIAASNAAEGEAAPLPKVNVGHLVDPSSDPVPELMNTLNDTESPNIPTGNMDKVAVTQVPQVTAGPPEPPAGGYANETNSDKDSENAIINNTGYDLDGEIAQLPEVTNEEPNSNQGAKRPIDFDVDAKNPMDVKRPSEPQNLADIVDEQGGNF